MRSEFRVLVAALCVHALVDEIRAAEPVDPKTTPVGSRMRHRVVELATGLAHPWSLAFLPDGTALITERNGGLRVFRNSTLEPRALEGLPAAHQKVDGGLLGIVVHPRFATNQWIYICLSQGTTEANHSVVVRARFTPARLEDVKVIFEARPLKKGDNHFGCRLLFAPDGRLLVTLGDGYEFRAQAQALDSHLGKVVRLTDAGGIPSDNPFAARRNTLPEIYTFGHRNVQGIALRPGTSEVWTHEHGARGGDEINVLRAGANYGWPLVTFGIDYSGETISPHTTQSGVTSPRFYWVPSIAPSGMDFYTGERFPEWRGDLFVGALAARSLYRLDIAEGQIVGQEVLLAERKERIREVKTGPDGLLYVLTDAADGKLLRLEPLEKP